MKKLKRNAVILTAILFVGVAVYLNWSYGQKESQSALVGKKEKSENVSKTGENQTDYFANVRLNRQNARLEASAALETVSKSEGVDQKTIDAAAEEMVKISKWTAKEAELESMITAKGFSQCVVFMSDEGVTVTVSKTESGLSGADTAKITDIITSQTDYTADKLTVIEV